jgi:hypothetical protein
MTGVTAIAAGPSQSFVVRSDGTVLSWGYNPNGQLGDTVAERVTPTPINGLTGVRSIVTGTNHILAIKTDGTVWGWGQNAFGQTGSSNFSNINPTPTPVSNLSGVVAAASAWGFSVALKADGTVWGWGLNSEGIFGNGPPSSDPRPVPAQISLLANVKAISSGDFHALALLNDGTLRSWGDNQYGQLGDGTLFRRFAPVQVSGVLVVAQPDVYPGSYNAYPPIQVRVTGDTAGSVIHYTSNGQDPTESDPIVISGHTLTINQNLTLKVRAFKPGWFPSTVSTSVYTLLTQPTPIDDTREFVRQQYLDFLNREPDPGGWDYWSSVITPCGLDGECLNRQRVIVSAAFFIELEFQQTGYVVYRMHRAAFGTVLGAPTRANVLAAQFNADRALLVGGSGLPQSTIDLANNFVTRAAFKTEYPDSMTPAEFVTKLFSKADLTGSANDALRQAEIDAMTNSGRTRAQVLLNVIEIQAFKDREYKPAFVLMQYFGYLRRDPDQGGYDFWLNILNNHLSNDSAGYRAMVCAFVTSGEYQLRFGNQITHTDHDCSP